MHRLESKLLVRFVGTAALSLILMGVIAMPIISNHYRNDYRSRLEDCVRGIELDIHSSVSTLIQTAKALNADRHLVNLMAQGDRHALYRGLESIRRLMDVDEVTATDCDGVVLIRVHNPGQFGDVLHSNGNTPNSGLAHDGSGLAIQVVQPIIDDGQHIGTVRLGRLFGHHFLEVIKNKYGIEGILRMGDRLQATTLNDVGTIQELVQSQHVTTTPQPSRAAGYFVSSLALHSHGGDRIASLDVAISERRVQEAIILFGAFFGSTAMLLCISNVILGKRFSRSIVAPVTRLVDVAGKVADGDFNQRLEVTTQDEIGALTNAMNQMIENLRKSTTSIDRLNAEVHERMRAEKALEQSERMYRGIVEDQSEFIVRWLPDGTRTFVNDAYCRYFNQPREQLIGTTFFPLINDQDRENIQREIKSIDRDNPVRHGEHRVILPDGSAGWNHWTDRAEFDADGRLIGFLSIGRDITDRKKAEDERAKLQEQLNQSQKLEAVGTLAAGVAHDFNNLLTAIDSYTSLTKQNLPDDHAAHQYLDMVRQASHQAVGVTRSLLTFAHRASLEKTPTDLSQLMVDSIRFVQRLVPASIEIIDEIAMDPRLWVRCDPTQIQQVLLNLAANARDAMPEGGQLRVTLRHEAVEEPPLGRPGPDNCGGTAVWTLEDNGVGISEKNLDRIFEPFYTTKEVGKGTGLGLSVAYGIIKDHAGQLEVESELGRGTRFTIHLPLCEAPEEQETRSEHDPQGGQHKGLIVIAEDNPLVRGLLATSLEAAGHEVIVTSNGEEAMRAIHDRGTELSLVVLDVDMPKKTGLVCMAEIQQSWPSPQIVMITGSASPEIDNGILGSIHHLRKPFQMSELVDLVARLVNNTRK